MDWLNSMFGSVNAFAWGGRFRGGGARGVF